MDKNKGSAVDDFLNEVDNSNENFVEDEKNPLGDMKIEFKEGEGPDGANQGNNADEGGKKKDEDEKPVPYHQDPKLQKFIAKKIEEATRHLTPQQREEVKDKVADRPDVVAAFAAIIGNDTPEKVNALKLLKDTLDGFASEARAGRELIEGRERAEREAQESLQRGFSEVEESFDVDMSSGTPQAKKLRAEFIDFVRRVAPKNAKGEIVEYPDFHETFAVFNEMRKKNEPSNRAKELAGRSMARSGDASKVPVPEDSSWKGVDKLFSKLKGGN